MRVGNEDRFSYGHASHVGGLDYGFMGYVENLDAVRQALGQTRIGMLGHGWGAAMAVEYATYKGGAMFDPASAMARYDLTERTASMRQDLPVLILRSRHDANYVAPAARHPVLLAQTVRQAERLEWDRPLSVCRATGGIRDGGRRRPPQNIEQSGAMKNA